MNFPIDINDYLHPCPSDDVLNALFADGLCGIAFARIHANEAAKQPTNRPSQTDNPLA